MLKENIHIRETKENDFNDIMEVETLAFGKDKEAKLTAGLLKDPMAEPMLSLLAFHKEEAIGHILFSRIYFEDSDEQPLMHLLAPLAIKPGFQKQGVGGKLINKGLEILKKRGSEIVIVIGHMDYYPMFGFIPDAKRLGFITPYPIPEEFNNAWMVQELKQGSIHKYNGKIQCADELQNPDHWRE